MTDSCARVDGVIEEAAGGGMLAPDLAAHLGSCPACQAHLALARRIDRVLAEWPVALPPPHFAALVAGRARQNAWRQEVVVDWGFNIALAASLAVILVGAGGFLWLLGAMADPVETSRLVVDQLARLGGRLGGEGSVVATATVLLTTTVVVTWWAEARQRW